MARSARNLGTDRVYARERRGLGLVWTFRPGQRPSDRPDLILLEWALTSGAQPEHWALSRSEAALSFRPWSGLTSAGFESNETMCLSRHAQLEIARNGTIWINIRQIACTKTCSAALAS